MGYVEIPLTAAAVTAARAAWPSHLDGHPGGQDPGSQDPGSQDPGGGVRLSGGEESSAYRIGDLVLRIGPRWRADDELERRYQLATALAATVPEVIAPLPTNAGTTVVRADGRPLSLWPFVAGSWGDDRDSGQRAQAARLLARLHRAAVNQDAVDLPRVDQALAARGTPADLVDTELDQWLTRFWATADGWQPIHGDFYAGNVLAMQGRIVAVLDWDELVLAPPLVELVWAAWEWGDGLLSFESGSTGATEFACEYLAAGGPAPEPSDVDFRQLVRARLRMEVATDRARWSAEGGPDADDRKYQDRQLAAFEALRPERGQFVV